MSEDFDRLFRLKGGHFRPRLLRFGGVGYVDCLGIPPQNRSGPSFGQTQVRSETVGASKDFSPGVVCMLWHSMSSAFLKYALNMELFCGLGAERICCTGFPCDKIFYCLSYTMDCLQGQENHFVI